MWYLIPPVQSSNRDGWVCLVRLSWSFLQNICRVQSPAQVRLICLKALLWWLSGREWGDLLTLDGQNETWPWLQHLLYWPVRSDSGSGPKDLQSPFRAKLIPVSGSLDNKEKNGWLCVWRIHVFSVFPHMPSLSYIVFYVIPVDKLPGALFAALKFYERKRFNEGLCEEIHPSQLDLFSSLPYCF